MNLNEQDPNTWLGIAGLLVGIASLMVTLGLSGYFIVAVASALVGCLVGFRLASRTT